MNPPRDLSEPLPDQLVTRVLRTGLNPAYLVRVARMTLAEDLAGGVDVTSVATIPDEARATADLVARAPGVVAGLPVAEVVVHLVTGGDHEVEYHVADGDPVEPGQRLLSVTASTRSLLTAERSALNLLCRLSGIATTTRRWVDEVAGTGAEIRDTRKTTPGMRALEKYAVRRGGGVNHRMGLWDVALVKDNHVVAAGSVEAAFAAVRETFPGLAVEVEVDRLDQIPAVLEAGAEEILLDNMDPSELRKAVELVAGRARLEASGGLTLAGARSVAETGVDYLAVGALTHSAPILDIACDLRAS